MFAAGEPAAVAAGFSPALAPAKIGTGICVRDHNEHLGEMPAA